MKKLFWYNTLKLLKLGGLSSPIKEKVQFICYSQVKGKRRKPDRNKKVKRTAIDILCKGKQKRVYNIKISYKVLGFEANKSSQKNNCHFILKSDTFKMKILEA